MHVPPSYSPLIQTDKQLTLFYINCDFPFLTLFDILALRHFRGKKLLLAC